MILWWADLKLAKMIILAILLSIVAYYAPSIFLSFIARVPGVGYMAEITPEAPPTTTEEETLRALTETVERLEGYYQVFIYNIILSITIALIAFTVIRKIYM